MINIVKPNCNLEIRFVNDEIGYGIFTNSFIKADEIVEMCYCINIGILSTLHPSFDYVFYNRDKKINFFPFGFGCIYNHDKNPNIYWDYTDDNKFIIFKSLKDINPNEELRHNYGEIYWKIKEKKII